MVCACIYIYVYNDILTCSCMPLYMDECIPYSRAQPYSWNQLYYQAQLYSWAKPYSWVGLGWAPTPGSDGPASWAGPRRDQWQGPYN